MSEETGADPATHGPVVDQDGHLDAGSLGVVAWVTDVGHARKRNEDRLLVKRAFGERFLLLVVADGAGGHNRGDKAAETVVLTLDEVFSTDGEPPEGPPADWLTQVVLDIHAKVRGLAEGESRPPASTLVGLLVEEETLCAWRFHVGDSRLYGQRSDAAMMTWTRDHNITNGLIDRGLPVSQALKIAEGGKLTQVMGGGAEPEPEIRGPFQLRSGDSFLICSDGIFGYNEDRDPLSAALDRSGGTTVERAAQLKADVLAGDALDNLTAVLWDVPDDAQPARQRLGLVEPYDKQDVGTMVEMTAHRPHKKKEDPQASTGDRLSPVTPSGKGPTPEDIARAEERLERGDDNAGLKFGLLLMATLGILAAFVWARRDTGEPLTEEQMAADRAQARALAGLPAEEPGGSGAPPTPLTGGPLDPELAQLLAGFEPGWWAGLDESQRAERTAVLRELLATREAEEMSLRWEVGDPPAQLETSRSGWPAPGGANAELAGTAWSARGRILGLYGDLASQPGVAEAMRVAACDQITIRWPAGGGATAEDAVQLPSWLGACLPPDVDGASVSVVLGAYPDAGWTDEDWGELATLAGSPGGAAAITSFDPTWNPRLVEIGQLTRALSQRSLQDVEVEARVALDPSDPPDLAQRRADQVAMLLREGSGGVLQVQAIGTSDDPLIDAGDDVTPGQAAKIAALNRRLEVTLFRSSALELDEDEAEPPTPK